MFHTGYHRKVQLSLPEVSDLNLIKWLVYPDDSMANINYNIIIGQDLLKKLGTILNFGAGTMIWHKIAVLIKDADT